MLSLSPMMLSAGGGFIVAYAASVLLNVGLLGMSRKMTVIGGAIAAIYAAMYLGFIPGGRNSLLVAGAGAAGALYYQGLLM